MRRDIKRERRNENREEKKKRKGEEMRGKRRDRFSTSRKHTPDDCPDFILERQTIHTKLL